jgi:hypothetical protein
MSDLLFFASVRDLLSQNRDFTNYTCVSDAVETFANLTRTSQCLGCGRRPPVRMPTARRRTVLDRYDPNLAV